MCSYKVVNASFEVFGFQTRVEEFVQSVSKNDGFKPCLKQFFQCFKLGYVKIFVWSDFLSVSSYIRSKFLNFQCVREVLLLGHRQAFAWIDQWIDMTYEDVRRYEAQLQQQTNSILLKNPTNSSPPITPTLASGDGRRLSSSASSTPTTPKSPTKKGYFSWFWLETCLVYVFISVLFEIIYLLWFCCCFYKYRAFLCAIDDCAYLLV